MESRSECSFWRHTAVVHDCNAVYKWDLPGINIPTNRLDEMYFAYENIAVVFF
jgi:hypothetical protein